MNNATAAHELDKASARVKHKGLMDWVHQPLRERLVNESRAGAKELFVTEAEWRFLHIYTYGEINTNLDGMSLTRWLGKPLHIRELL